MKVQIRSHHPSHDALRGAMELPFKSVVRLGSTTNLEDTVTNGGDRIECNTIESIKNSSNKLLMKKRFTEFSVKTADWWTISTDGNSFYPSDNRSTSIPIRDMQYPLVGKYIYGSRNTGNTLIKSKEELVNWFQGKNASQYIVEKFFNYSQEFRLHCTEEGYFYACRKGLKSDTPENQRWYRNDSNCVWYIESNPLFNRPSTWNLIVAECVKALKAVKLDIGGFDVRVNGDGKFIIIESNSACSHADITTQKYLEAIPNVLKRKYDIHHGYIPAMGRTVNTPIVNGSDFDIDRSQTDTIDDSAERPNALLEVDDDTSPEEETMQDDVNIHARASVPVNDIDIMSIVEKLIEYPQERISKKELLNLILR